MVIINQSWFPDAVNFLCQQRFVREVALHFHHQNSSKGRRRHFQAKRENHGENDGENHGKIFKVGFISGQNLEPLVS